jgi:hypothetical protein
MLDCFDARLTCDRQSIDVVWRSGERLTLLTAWCVEATSLPVDEPDVRQLVIRLRPGRASADDGNRPGIVVLRLFFRREHDADACAVVRLLTPGAPGNPATISPDSATRTREANNPRPDAPAKGVEETAGGARRPVNLTSPVSLLKSENAPDDTRPMVAEERWLSFEPTASTAELFEYIHTRLIASPTDRFR